jgi:hypothetical protein
MYAHQLAAAHKEGVQSFSDAVGTAVKLGQKKGSSYEFAEIVSQQKEVAAKAFEKEAKALQIPGAAWSEFSGSTSLFVKELDEVSGRLRREEMRRLATRVERWVKTRLAESVGLEFNKLGSGRGGQGAPETGSQPEEKEIWDRIWALFTSTVKEAESKFLSRATSFDASDEEKAVGIWRLRRKAWGVLKARVEEECMEGNLLLKLRENFEDRFRYDKSGTPRIWRPTDDIDAIFHKSRDATLGLIPLLSRFRLSSTLSSPPLEEFIGAQPDGTTADDEEDLTPIGGIDGDEGSLDEEMQVLSEAKRQDLVSRFRKTAEAVYVEAKRSALGGVTQIPVAFWAVLLALGWNEILAGMFALPHPVWTILSMNSVLTLQQSSATLSTSSSSFSPASPRTSPGTSTSGAP